MRIAPFPYNTTRRSKMACEDCVNLEDHLRMYKEETCLLKNALCEKNESSPQPKQRSTSSTPATAMSEWHSVSMGFCLSSPCSMASRGCWHPLTPVIYMESI
ncbi:uncharacterized protein LOC143018986 isoform X2 [Oratosquilla oratoria]|uniref:uncharacterized protein LOC143018986 isoform X2 n=1 Tax=Oratosquilla oratoria TaxID=337810 RepID=UPI003F76A7FB